MKAWTYVVHGLQTEHDREPLQKWFFTQVHVVSSTGVQSFATSKPKNEFLKVY